MGTNYEFSFTPTLREFRRATDILNKRQATQRVKIKLANYVSLFSLWIVLAMALWQTSGVNPTAAPPFRNMALLAIVVCITINSAALFSSMRNSTIRRTAPIVVRICDDQISVSSEGVYFHRFFNQFRSFERKEGLLLIPFHKDGGFYIPLRMFSSQDQTNAVERLLAEKILSVFSSGEMLNYENRMRPS